MVYAPYLGNLVGITSSVGQAAFAGFTSGLVGSGGDLKQAFIGGVFAVFSAGVLHGMDTGWRKTFAHGLTGGARSKVSGGRFKDGFIGGFVGQSLEQHEVYKEMGITSTPRNYTERMYNAVASFVVGGTSARLTGGSFTNGGMSAAFARMFNDLATVGVSVNVPIPGFIQRLFGIKAPMHGGSAGIVFAFPGATESEWDIGVYYDVAIGGESLEGMSFKGTMDIGYETTSSISAMNGTTAEMGAHYKVLGAKLVTDQSGVINGGKVSIGPGYSASSTGVKTTSCSVRSWSCGK